MKIYRRENNGKIERFLTGNLDGCDEEENKLRNEFNKIQMHEMVVLYQNNPIRMEDGSWKEEQMRLEFEYLGYLQRIFACNDIPRFIENMDRTEKSMASDMEEEKKEIVEDLKNLYKPTLSYKEEKENATKS